MHSDKSVYETVRVVFQSHYTRKRYNISLQGNVEDETSTEITLVEGSETRILGEITGFSATAEIPVLPEADTNPKQVN